MKVSIINLQTFKSSDRQLRIKQGGNVYVSLRLALILSCQMDFKYYPFDWQLCPLEMSSFGYRKDEIVFEFETLEEIDNLKAVRVNPGINLPRKCVSSMVPIVIRRNKTPPAADFVRKGVLFPHFPFFKGHQF